MTKKRTFNLRLLVALLCLVMLFSPLLVQVAAQATQATLTPNHDSYVEEDNADRNRGNDSDLRVESRSGSRNNRTFIRFDVLSSVPLGASVTSARLRLYMNSAPSNGRTYLAHSVLNNWVESGPGGITWNNQPNVAGAVTASASVGTTDGQWIEWDVTADVQAVVSGAQADYGWRLTDSAESESGTSRESRFRSSEHGTTSERPQLVVDYDPSVAPTATHTPTETPTETPVPPPTSTPIPSCGTTYWVSPSSSGGGWGAGDLTGAYADDSASVACQNCSGSTAWYGGYDFGLPADASIQGIETRLDWWLDDVAGSSRIDVLLSWDGGGSWTAAYPAATERATDGNPTDVEGGAADTWGRIWTANDLDPSRFRVRAVASSDVGSRVFYLDWVAVRLNYCTSSSVVPPTPTVTPSPTPTNTPSQATPTPTIVPTPTPTSMPSGTRFGVYDSFELCALGYSDDDGGVRPKPPGLRDCGNLISNTDFETSLVPWTAGAGTLDVVRSSRFSCDTDGRVDSYNVGSFSLLFRCDWLHGYGGYPFDPWAFQDFVVPDYVSSTQPVQTEMNVSLYYLVPPASLTVAGRPEDKLRVVVQDSGGVDLSTPVEITNGGIAGRGTVHSFSADLASGFSLPAYAGQTIRLRLDAPNPAGDGNSEFFVDQVRCEVCTTISPPAPEPSQAYRLGGYVLVVLAGHPTEMPGVDVWAIQLEDGSTPPSGLDFQSTYSIQDSTYDFYNLNPGTYRIYAEVWISGNLYSATQTVTIGQGETNTQVNLTLI